MELYPSIEEYINKENGSKYAMIITKEQCAMVIGSGDHAFLMKDIIDRIRPDVEVNEYGNPLNGESFEDDNILIYGWRNYGLFILPREGNLSTEQYDRLIDILSFIDEHNKDNNPFTYEVSGYGNIKAKFDNYNSNADIIASYLSSYVTPLKDDYKEKEVIVGIDLLNKNNKTK